MKATGEVMGVGRTFEESLFKSGAVFGDGSKLSLYAEV